MCMWLRDCFWVGGWVVELIELCSLWARTIEEEEEEGGSNELL